MLKVEVWLNRIQERMRSSLRTYMSEAVVSYEEKPREQWLFDYPAQVSLCGTQIWWTTEVNMAFERLEEVKHHYYLFKNGILQLNNNIFKSLGI